MKEYKWGRPLEPGDTIGIVAPASPAHVEDWEQGAAFLRGLGYKTKIFPSVYAQIGYLAGSDALRAQDVNAAFADAEVQAIICMRGGYGSARILPLLDYELIRSNPKLFMGFSDITALHIQLQQRCHLVSVHGPMLTSFHKKLTEYTLEQFTKGLMSGYSKGAFPLPKRYKLRGVIPGKARGRVYGGNLSLLAALIGTPYELDGSGGILFLEEVHEEVYAIDRKLCQLEQSGLIGRVEGIVCGEFSRCLPAMEDSRVFTVRHILREYAAKWQKPMLLGLPLGHNTNNGWLPLGAMASMEVQSEGEAAFNLE